MWSLFYRRKERREREGESKGEKERREGKRKACEKYLDYSMKLILLNHIKQEHKSIGKFQDAVRPTRGCWNLEKNTVYLMTLHQQSYILVQV